MAEAAEPDGLGLAGGVGALDLEVGGGGGGVKEQQVDLEVQQVRHRPVHRFGEVVFDLQQPVHRPVAGVHLDGLQPWQGDPFGHPGGGSQLRQRLKRPVRDQGEDHPLGGRVETASRQQLGQGRVDPQPVPQAVEHPRASHGPRVHEVDLVGRGCFQRLPGAEQSRQGADEPGDGVSVDPVGPPEVVDHPYHRLPGGGVPLVVSQLQVAHLGAVLVPPGRRTQVHIPRRYLNSPPGPAISYKTCTYAKSARDTLPNALTCTFTPPPT